MKVKVEGYRLQEGLKKVIGVANARISPSVLGNVLVEAKEGKMSLTASNLDITLITSVDCEIEEPGVTTVPAKMFQSVVAALPVGMVEIVVDAKDKMKVISGESSFRISGTDAKEFPKLAKVKDESAFSLEAKDLKAAIRKTSFAQSLDVTRKSLAGVLFDFNGEHLRTVATDGRRLALTLVKAAWKCADTQFTLPTVAVKEVQRLIADDGGVTIRFSGGLAVFDLEKAETKMYAKVLAEPYPNYMQVIPKDTQFKAVCDRVRMIDMMNRAKVMALDTTPSVKLTFDKGKLDATVVGMDDGEGRDKFAIKYDGEKTEFAFNPYYLGEALGAIDADNVVIEMTTGTNPILIKGEGEGGLSVLMPLKRN